MVRVSLPFYTNCPSFLQYDQKEKVSKLKNIKVALKTKFSIYFSLDSLQFYSSEIPLDDNYWAYLISSARLEYYNTESCRKICPKSRDLLLFLVEELSFSTLYLWHLGKTNSTMKTFVPLLNSHMIHAKNMSG